MDNATWMSETRIRRRLVVHGRVQGVFFRDAVRDRASTHGVAGWARNRQDGTVEIVLEGSPEAVQRVIPFCEEGPSRAEVESVDVHEEPPEGLTGFEVGYCRV